MVGQALSLLRYAQGNRQWAGDWSCQVEEWAARGAPGHRPLRHWALGTGRHWAALQSDYCPPRQSLSTGPRLLSHSGCPLDTVQAQLLQIQFPATQRRICLCSGPELHAVEIKKNKKLRRKIQFGHGVPHNVVNAWSCRGCVGGRGEVRLVWGDMEGQKS